MSDAVISLLIQVPLVGAFIVFTLMLVREFRSDTKTRQVEMMTFISEQNSRWQDLLREERERRREAMDSGLREMERLASTVTALTQVLSENTKAILAHDVAARERHGTIERKFERMGQ